MGKDKGKSGVDPKVRATEILPEQMPNNPSSVLQLEVALEENHLKISAHEYLPGEESTIRHYELMGVSMDRIETRCREMVETLSNANRNGRLTPEVLIRLREVGQVFYDEFLPINIKQKLNETKAEYLKLYLDDQVVHIPWELLHNGQQFLCNRFNIGRLVKTRQTVLGSRSRVLSHPLKMLILADPGGDLKGAYMEGTQIRDYMDLDKDLVNVSVRSGNITPDFVKEKIRNFDLVHFAGHADYNRKNPQKSGWRLTGDTLNAEDITKMAGSATMPALIFSNACQSARTEKWTLTGDFQDEIFGLANAFLLTGVKHYIGTFWEILDEPSSRFALEFYKYLLAGRTTGEAIRLARLALIKEYGEETIVWASYLLYGDPTSNYLDHIRVTDIPDEPESDRVGIAEPGVRAREEVIDFTDQEVTKRTRAWWAVVAGVILVAATLFWGYSLLSKKEIAKYQKAALVHYHEGNFEEALNVCNVLEEKKPNASLPYLIRGNIYLRKEKLDVAEPAYRNALEASEGTDLQRAEALSGLGRIASLRRKPAAALKYYQQATEAAPQSRQGYLSQALLLESEGKYEDALDLLMKAGKLAPEDQVVAALVNETRKRVTVSADQEKQDRIDRMVKELVESPPTFKPSPSDGWTSFPLTMWVMDFEAQGYSLQEGEERLLVSGIVGHMLQQSRVQLVERSLLDKVLREFKLGTSKLIDPGTALSLGKMLAARLIVSGRVVYSEKHTQVSMRLIETETGRITAAVNESFGSSVPASVLTERLAGNLLAKLKGLYPLRGKTLETNGQTVRVNVGQKAGVRVGQRFKVLEEDAILEVISIERDTSLAKIIKGENTLQKGLRVEALTESNLD